MKCNVLSIGTRMPNVAKRNQRSVSHKRMVSALVLVGIAALGPPEASAEDGKLYAGAECRAYSGAIVTNSFAAVYNSSATTSASVVCPVIHDSLGDQDINSAVVTVIDANNDAAAQRVSCRLLAHLRNNGNWFGTWTSEQFSIDGDPATLNFGNLVTSNDHHYYIRCTIPPRDQDTNAASYIVSYRVDEDS